MSTKKEYLCERLPKDTAMRICKFKKAGKKVDSTLCFACVSNDIAAIAEDSLIYNILMGAQDIRHANMIFKTVANWMIQTQMLAGLMKEVLPEIYAERVKKVEELLHRDLERRNRDQKYRG